MQYKRTKPNSHPWKKPSKSVPALEQDTAPIFSDEAIAAMLAASRDLDEVCAANGHHFREYIFPGEIVCAICGRTPDEH